MKDTYKAFRYTQRRLMIMLAVIASVISTSALLTQIFLEDRIKFVIGIGASALGAVIAYLMAEALHFIRSKQVIFVSYTHADSELVKQLIDKLSDLNVRFLVDRLELKVGDNIKTAVDRMIDEADSIIFVVSKSSAESNWAKKELEQALSRKKKVLPVVIDREAIPEPLSGLYYADFSKNLYENRPFCR